MYPLLVVPSLVFYFVYVCGDLNFYFLFFGAFAEEGDTKDDLQLPTYPDGFGNEIKNQFDEGKTLVRAKKDKKNEGVHAARALDLMSCINICVVFLAPNPSAMMPLSRV